VGSKCDLHLLCSVSQLGCHRHNLHFVHHKQDSASDQQLSQKNDTKTHNMLYTYSQAEMVYYLGWVTERIFIHHITGRQNSSV
jgi:hypothetical protein